MNTLALTAMAAAVILSTIAIIWASRIGGRAVERDWPEPSVVPDVFGDVK